MSTRSLASKAVLRGCIHEMELLEAKANTLLFKTKATLARHRHISSGDSEMFNQKDKKQIGKDITGRLQIEVISDTAIRVRYNEGRRIKKNDTPMVVGELKPPCTCKIKKPRKGSAGVTTVQTAKRIITIDPQQQNILITDTKGSKLCGIGGPEKNNFRPWDSYNTGVCRSAADGRAVAVENFDLAPNESIYGLGEQFIRLNKVGQTIDLDMIDAHGCTTPRSYKNVPFYVSTAGYGVYFNHSSVMTYYVGSMSACDVQVAADDDFLDYYVFSGSINEVLSDYTTVTGKGVVPPAWSYGYWQSKFSYESAEETLEIARQMRKHKIPCDVIHLDTYWFEKEWYCTLEFGKDRFPDPEAYLRELAGMGIKVSLWQLPYIPEGFELFKDLLAVDGFIKDKDGNIAKGGFCFVKGFKGRVGIVDYSNPKAVKVHQKYFKRLLDMGAKVIKTDFGENAPLDGVYHDGTPGHQMHNRYPLLYNKALFEVTKEGTGDGVVWARSAWAGNQRYPLHWGGDNSPNYHNIIPQIEGGLSFGLSGFQFWSQDIGGFCGVTNDPLLIRWMQLGMFISHIRIHGSGDRELYKFKPETVRICTKYIRLRYRLLPYILASSHECVRDSLPMLRALVVDYQDDPNTHNMSDQWLFGQDLLVAPIYDEDNRRRVYLPAGTWTDWWTGKRIAGNQWLDVEVDIETMPLYIREGAVIPMGPVLNYVGEKPTAKLDVRVSLFEGPGRRKLRVPVDGKFITLDYESTGRKHVLTVSKTKVDLKVRTYGKGKLTIKRK